MRQRNSREFALLLRADVNGWWFSPEHRLRAALKVMLRRYGLRCLECRPYVRPVHTSQHSPEQPPPSEYP